jgi:uncharacterized protein
MPFLPLRLKPNCDLRRSLEDAARQDGHASAFVVSGIGSLSGATLRFAGADEESRLAGMFEIVSLSGTISADGAHLHMTIADADGRVVGGHVCYGNEIRTTAEVLLARLEDWRLSRAFDVETGYQELVVDPE